jgi:hypothetical protein
MESAWANTAVSAPVTVTSTTTSSLGLQGGGGVGMVIFVDISAIGAGDTWTFKAQYLNSAGAALDLTTTSAGSTTTGTATLTLTSPYTTSTSTPLPSQLIATLSVNGGAPTITYKVRAVFSGNAFGGTLPGNSTAKFAQSGTSVLAAALTGGTYDFTDWTADMTLAAPANAPTLGATFTSLGSCRSDTTYQFAVIAYNPSGQTSLSPTLSWTPSSGNTNRATINQPTLPTGATAWSCAVAKSTESFSTWRQCSAIATDLLLPAATTTVIATCSSSTTYTTANTTGVITIRSLYDGETRDAARLGADADDPRLTASTRRFNTAGLQPTWTADSGSTITQVLTGGAVVKQVCKNGCLYSTVQAAVTACGTPTSTSRCIVYIMPGDYDETPILIDYIDLVGTSAGAVRIRGSDLTLQYGVNLSNGTSSNNGNNVLANLTIGGRYAIAAGDGGSGSTRKYLIILSSIIGITDGSENGTKTQIAISPRGGEDVYAEGNVYFGTEACLYSTGASGNMTSTTYRGSGNTCNISATTDTAIAAYQKGDECADIFEAAPIIYISSDSTTKNVSAVLNNRANGSGGDACNGADLGAFITMRNAAIHIETTNTGRTATTACLRADTNISAGTTKIDMGGSSCEIIAVSGDAASVLEGVHITADTHHSATDIRWIGGRIRLSGGGTRNDANNAETVGGFSLTLGDIDSTQGTVTGAGTTTILRELLPSGAIRNTGLASKPASCIVGDTYIDNTAGAVAFCLCTVTGTPGTWEAQGAGTCN